MLNILYQSHAGSWLFLVIAFIVSCIFRKQKISPIIMRIFLLIMLVSGIGMLIILGFPIVYVVKAILALVLIASMEIILGRLRRGRPTGMLWGLFAVSLILVILFGYGVITF